MRVHGAATAQRCETLREIGRSHNGPSVNREGRFMHKEEGI